MPDAPYTGKGWTVTFGTSSFSMNNVSIQAPGPSSDPIPTTHLGTTGKGLTFNPADFYDAGELSLTGFLDPSTDIPVNQENETITIDFTGTGDTSDATWEFTGHITGYAPGAATFNERVEVTVTVKVSGEITVTPAV